jgi:hypothetical protein
VADPRRIGAILFGGFCLALALFFVAIALLTGGGPARNPAAFPLILLGLMAAVVGGVVVTIARRARDR